MNLGERVKFSPCLGGVSLCGCFCVKVCVPTDFCEKVRSEVSMGHISHQCVLTGITSVGEKAGDGVGRAKVSHEPRLLICSAADIFFVVSWDSKVLEQKSPCGSCQSWFHFSPVCVPLAPTISFYAILWSSSGATAARAYDQCGPGCALDGPSIALRVSECSQIYHLCECW